MAADEILSCSKFYLEIDGLKEKIIKSISGIGITLEAAGDKAPFGVSKGGKTQMQATVTSVTHGTVTVVFMSTVGDDELMKWFEDSHSEPIKGGGSANKGALKNFSITLYNQGGEEAARWNFQNAMPKSYKSNKFDPSTADLASETVELVYSNMHRVK